MNFKMYQVDAFTNKLFAGNPAAVCILGTEWLPDNTMLQIAAENNLAETAFVVGTGENYSIRWFTPAVEVDLCGHATLASAHVLFQHEGFTGEQVVFASRSGNLGVKKLQGVYRLDFPVDTVSPVQLTSDLLAGFDIEPIEAYRGKTDFLLVFKDEKEILEVRVDFSSVAKVKARGIIITAPGTQHDFVSRFFGPQSGIDEDPVTGSAHTSLVPIWAQKLGRTEFKAAQLSKRGGELYCELVGERVYIKGSAKTFFEARVEI
jgi:PhzF family phenazine biosynthesis protein